MRLFLIFCFSLGWFFPAISAEMALSIKGEHFIWQSAQRTEQNLLPAAWDVPLHLPAADKVIPGGPVTTATTLTLTGDGQTVAVPVIMVGMTYQLSSNVALEDVTGTGVTTVAGGSVSATVMGSGTGNKAVTLAALSSPFTHYRPIIKNIDEADWLAKFKLAGLNAGLYQGIINYIVPYNYERNGVLVRYTLQESLTIKVDYQPAQLTTVHVTGDGYISPQYYGLPERLVGGTVDYTINATGVFPNGVNVGLKNTLGLDSSYQMKSQSVTMPATSINYSVKCSFGCEGDNSIITNGIADINSTNLHVKMRSADNKTAQSTITVSFSNKKLSELNNDIYSGSFTLIFEAGL